ncbi:RTA1 like protein-domain-containing protein [Ilyonectria robusta]|uniref:RTA1 like protein-domain-containing protein n=1 Tax=Ilyonectria robusta TaxID=1079257 RepID=UPI001E8EBFB7|nr:RTA1 like protein-domain-containing protein [Ilyonectria robusta]KAH8651457.1 RTA1 like protein-domain-containing protein [Ilyonectria robusta]
MARELYRYDPSLAAAVIFIIIFAASALFHSWQLVRTKNWYFIPFVVGCLAEAIGCIARAIGAKESPDWTLGPFVIQSLLLLLGPTIYAASIYMVLGRLIQLLEADKHSLIRPNWLTKFFLLGDVISIAAQGLGGSMLASADNQKERDKGETIIIIGLAVQILFFGLFMISTLIFHRRINRDPTQRSLVITVPWRRLLVVLYVTSLLILVRSVFRVIEYVMGHDGVLQSKEVFIYVFDILLMAGVAIIFNVFHPSEVLTAPRKERGRSSDSEMQLGGYGQVRSG